MGHSSGRVCPLFTAGWIRSKFPHQEAPLSSQIPPCPSPRSRQLPGALSRSSNPSGSSQPPRRRSADPSPSQRSPSSQIPPRSSASLHPHPRSRQLPGALSRKLEPESVEPPPRQRSAGCSRTPPVSQLLPTLLLPGLLSLLTLSVLS